VQIEITICNRSQHCNCSEAQAESSLMMVYVNRNMYIIILNDFNCLKFYNNLCALVGQIKELILSTCTVQL